MCQETHPTIENLPKNIVIVEIMWIRGVFLYLIRIFNIFMGWYGDILGIPASSRNSFHDVVIGLSPNLATTWWTTSRQAPTWRCGQHSVRRLSDQKTHDSASNRRTPRKRMQKSHIEPFSRWIWWETQGILIDLAVSCGSIFCNIPISVK